MNDYKLILPEQFDEYASDVESKGWFSDAIAVIDGNSYRLTFYDQVRLNQDVGEELKSSPVFFEPNVVVIRSVSRKNMERAVEHVARNLNYFNLVLDRESV